MIVKPQEVSPMAFSNDTVEVYTVQMGQWREVERLGIKFLDITAKSGIQCFAPDYATVMYYKDGNISDSDYTDLYFDKMLKSQKDFPVYWRNLNRYPKVALACYCKPGVFCHRKLFLKLMTYYLSVRNVKVISMGEITKEGVIPCHVLECSTNHEQLKQQPE
jgi:hypothetical protein